MLEPADCVVVTWRIPQAKELHPAPDSDQERAELGLEPGTGVSVATNAAVAPVARLEGAARPSVKLLVTETIAEDCLEGSAALVAVRVTFEAVGRTWGAV